MIAQPSADTHPQTAPATRVETAGSRLLSKDAFSQLAAAYNTGLEEGGLDEAFRRVQMKLKELGLDGNSTVEK